MRKLQPFLRTSISLLFFLLFFVINQNIFNVSVFAADFSFDYDVNYAVSTNGVTHVTQTVTVTNLITSVYAQNYTLTIPSEKIDNIKARDNKDNITPVVSHGNNQTIITLTFNEKVVGIRSQLPFTLEFDSRDIAKRQGRIWEIIIPGLEKNEEINSYNISLNVPDSFGKPAYFSPPARAGNVWRLEDHLGRGITAAYGDYQNFSFNLSYHLENKEAKTKMQEITLPPDTSYQKVIISRISKIPTNVYLDKDGNWLAQYDIAPFAKLDIMLEGQIYVYPNPQQGWQVELSQEEREIYTQPQKYWQIDDNIRTKAKELKTAKKIYDYIVDSLTYDYTRVTSSVERLGATTVFYDPRKAACMEFSDLFIAMARAAGIPAREIHGFAYTTNSRLQPLSLLNDVLHAWPEYYDEERKLWIWVDPTWENTTLGVDYFSKLDFNHIAFAILGRNSDYPYPAGSFRSKDSSKDVFVDFSANEIKLPDPEFKIEIDNKISLISGTKKNVEMLLKNTGQVLYAPKEISINSPLVNQQLNNQTYLIPPYGSVKIPISLFTNTKFKSEIETVDINVDGFNYQTIVTVKPFFYILLRPVSAIFLVLILFIIIYVKKRYS